MKLFFCSLCFILLTLTNHAQTIFFKEDFNKYTTLKVGGHWNTNTYTAQYGWRTSEMYNLYCSWSKIPQYIFKEKVAAISDCEGFVPRPNHDVLMYTPHISLGAAKNGVILKYDSYFNGRGTGSTAEKATIEISLNNGQSWTVLDNVTPGSTDDSMSAKYVNLTPYKGNPNILIGFRYNDGGGVHDQGGWAVDNIEIYESEKNDIGLTVFTPLEEPKSYAAIGSAYTHTGRVFNYGTDTVYNYTVNYQKGNGSILSYNVIATLPPLSAFDFTHPVPDTILSIGTADVIAWVELAGDTVADNDTIHTALRGAHFIPKKVVVLEEGTGNWHGYAPQGMVLKNLLETDSKTSIISIHTGDPMEYKSYDDYIYGIDQSYTAQYYLLDRKYNAAPSSLVKLANSYNQHFGFAELDMHAYTVGNDMWLTTTVKPAIDMQGDYRLAMVLTENNVSGSGEEWNQRNFFSGGKRGPMGGFENKPDTILSADIDYDHVAREIIPSPNGLPFRKEMKYGESYVHKFHAEINPSWNKNNLMAIVMLINNEDSTILNSNRLHHFLNVSSIEKNQLKLRLYPNPATDYTNITFETFTSSKDVSIIITDITGRVVKQIATKSIIKGDNSIQLSTDQFLPGIYLITLINEGYSTTSKLIVSH